MPASAKRAQRGRRDPRKDKDKDEDVAAAADLESSSPSRPAKRRKRALSPDHPDSLGLPPGAPSQAPESSQSQSHSPRAQDDLLVAQVTQQLRSQPVQASRDHSNSIHEANGNGVKAYAKVAAQDWTYYITKLNVNIGRSPEPSHGPPAGSGSDSGQAAVHIDLGPSKMVSREHATISFNSKDEIWMLHIKGRNGAKVDGQPVKPQTSHPLTSGEVIEIGNVEMMFVLPSELSALHIHPMFLQRCGRSIDTPKAAQPRQYALGTPAKAGVKRPGTPTSSQHHSAATVVKSPVAASTPGGLLGASGVDLSLDENQHIKPQYSYAQMITQAILNAPDGKLNLNGIYNFIMSTYSYYRHQHAAGWQPQNSIRHNLSLNKSFDKVARTTDEPGKGMKWHIVPEAREEMVRNAYKIGRGGHRGSSVPSSPSHLNYITHGPKDVLARDPSSARKRRGSPLVSPPPQSALRGLQSTPDRAYGRKVDRSSGPTADGSPLPRARKSTAADASFSGYQPQSPTLTSSYMQDDNASFVTPAPPRVHPKLAPPSTAQRPSQHMPTSSPAPFWKYADIGSTPLKPLGPYEVSPSRVAREAPPRSSSPPTLGKSPPSSPSRPQKLGLRESADPADEPEEEQGFDLMKGFQSIGAYHAPVERGVPIGTALKGGP
ncbi:fork head transcription factor-like protein [Trichoderma longibrachiatum ATCC 18648]|uniref:Fork head transcription factor-like protein n=1 Tax=Trichoderma longibrachiatum ATCC 18648 TaxID=983965 RepID=A0A2T4C1M6_TRILO|nr:fork head transcription factor-like protein [Trichoderma longibrachiatum ATCC 18648]